MVLVALVFFSIFCNKVGEDEDTEADVTERKEGELGEGDEEGDGERGEDRDVRIYYKITDFFTFPVYTEKSCPLKKGHSPTRATLGN